MNISLLLLSVIAAASVAGFYGYDYGMSKAAAQEAREKEIAQIAYDSANKSAAKAIARLVPKNTVIKQEIQRVIETNTVYRECVHPDGQLQLINEALTGDRAERTGDRVVPKDDRGEQ